MPLKIESQPMTQTERKQLARAGGRSNWFERLFRIEPWWVMLLFAIVMFLGFEAVVWIMEPVFGAGRRSGEPLALSAYALALGLFLTLIAIWAMFRFNAIARKNRRLVFGRYWDDLDSGVVDEERYEFEDCLSELDCEGGGQIYLLKIDAMRCLVLFDRESFALGGLGGGSLVKAMRPCRAAVLRRAPKSGMMMSVEFSGTAFDATPVETRGYDGPKWSDDGKIWNRPWDGIERRLREA
ncbi:MULTISPECIES: hypothetical protein [Lysobacter]|uniref:hypothetical protein n=1 Tax=Lysobacter TaxID=68 RepID=UPI001F183E41|nr:MULTISPECIES: hypothetical protein [Lysobacter]UJB17766.1 hypothetical protein L1A79_15505 [Lysobacter capsici]UJQ28512.1 hypothetical protein L2D09_24385 [Lysobacter gummosus]